MYQPLPEFCVVQCINSLTSTLLSDVKVELNSDWTPQQSSDTVNLIVKSLKLPSIDEIPIIEAILRTLSSKTIPVYEYDHIQARDSNDRVDRLAKILSRSIGRGGVILVVPSLLPVSLISRLDPDNLLLLESSLLLEAEVTYSNILYLPEDRDEIEIVAKKNSQSSYERAEWLKRKAEERGIKVARVKELSDNTSILNYVTRRGIDSIKTSVPVTKIASLIVTLSKCRGIDGIMPLVKDDSSKHLLYAVGIGMDEAEGIAETLRGMRGSRIGDILGDMLKSHIPDGCRLALGNLIRALY